MVARPMIGQPQNGGGELKARTLISVARFTGSEAAAVSSEGSASLHLGFMLSPVPQVSSYLYDAWPFFRRELGR